MTDEARRRWQAKLDLLLAEEVIATGAAQRFELQQQIAECRTKLAELDGEDRHHRDVTAPRVDLNHLPAGAEHFLGRTPELEALDGAWTPGSGVAVVELIAPGGTGKTALVKRWLEGVKARGWGGAVQVYGWSFYSQGTGDDRQASEDLFLASAIKRFGIEIAPSANPADKGQALADRLATGRTLLILDGLEPLQYPPGPMAGELRAPGLKTLLTQLAAAGHPGLCVVTSREWLQDLGEWVRTDANPRGGVLRLDLGNLSDTDGAALLHARGATRAGAAEIRPDDPELIAASREFSGHALALSLLGRYLARAKGGDIRRRDAVDPARADRDARGHAARVVAAYETWFAREGLNVADSRSRELAALRLLGLFDRPATRDLLEALRAAPPIPGLTEPLQDLTGDDWTLVLANLADCGLVQPDPRTGALDAHPLVREYLAAALAQRCPDAWREGHRRIYERLKGSVPYRPEGLDGLQPLYQAVAHGCRAGLYEEARAEVYRDRILRGTGGDGFYSWRKLGAFGANLGAVAYLFAEPWSRPASALAMGAQAWLLNETAIQLSALGRLGEALEPMRAGAEILVKREDWTNAARGYGSLSELELTLGRVYEAVADAERSMAHADRGGDTFVRMADRAILADALHQRGETEEARRRFAEAEAMQGEHQPQYPLLYSLMGFRYCDLLLAEAERAGWVAGPGAAETLAACQDVARRGRKMFEWRVPGDPLLDIALDHLTLARCALYADQLRGWPPGTEAQVQAEQAVNGLRSAGRQDYLPRGLITRAWLRHTLGDPAGAQSDLAEAERIASRGGMQLHLADCALHRARLFRDHQALAQARRLIESCHYGRRLPVLEDAERAAATWPAKPETHGDLPPTTPRTAPAGSEPASPAGTNAGHPHGPPAPGHQTAGRAIGAHDIATDTTSTTQVFDMTLDHSPEPVNRPVPAAEGPVDFLLVDPLPEERKALLARLPGHRKLPASEDDIRVYYAAEIPAQFPDGRSISYSAVVLPLAGMGHTQAATATADAIRRFQPRYVLLVGIAGGMAKNDVALGDVLLAEQVADYGSAKVTADGPSIRWQVHQVDQRLLIAAQNHDGSAFADTVTARPEPGQPQVHVGPICTGNKVIADNSLGDQMRDVWVKLIGVEMEAGGVARAAFQSACQPGFFMVRGVSDLADADKDRDEVKRWRQYACDIAAAWTLEWLKSGPVTAGAPAATATAHDQTSASASGAAKANQNPATPPPGQVADSAHSGAVALWREKLSYLLGQEAVLSSPAQRFELRQQIEECRAKLRELGNDA